MYMLQVLFILELMTVSKEMNLLIIIIIILFLRVDNININNYNI